MSKFLENLLEIICWVGLVLIPVLVFGSIGYIVKIKFFGLPGMISFVVLLIIGLLTGVFVAERIRKTIGCSSVFFRVFTSYDIGRKKAD